MGALRLDVSCTFLDGGRRSSFYQRELNVPLFSVPPQLVPVAPNEGSEADDDGDEKEGQKLGRHDSKEDKDALAVGGVLVEVVAVREREDEGREVAEHECNEGGVEEGGWEVGDGARDADWDS